MPRKRRFFLAGVPVHVVQRGNNRQAVFFDDRRADSAECDHRFRWEGDQAIHAKMTAGRSEATRDGT